MCLHDVCSVTCMTNQIGSLCTFNDTNSPFIKPPLILPFSLAHPQVNLYLLSRIVLGLVKVAVKKGYIPEPRFKVFPLFAGLMWGIVLCLFEYHQEVLQQSLQNSMTYIYHDSLVWSTLWDFLAYNNDVLW